LFTSSKKPASAVGLRGTQGRLADPEYVIEETPVDGRINTIVVRKDRLVGSGQAALIGVRRSLSRIRAASQFLSSPVNGRDRSVIGVAPWQPIGPQI